VCPREAWLHVQTVSCDGGQLDPAQDRNMSESKRQCSAWNTLFCQRILAIWHWHFTWNASSLFLLAANRVQVSQAYVKTGKIRVWQSRTLAGTDRYRLLQIRHRPLENTIYQSGQQSNSVRSSCAHGRDDCVVGCLGRHRCVTNNRTESWWPATATRVCVSVAC